LGLSSSPWHWKQWALKIGRISRSKSGRSGGFGWPGVAAAADTAQRLIPTSKP